MRLNILASQAEEEEGSALTLNHTYFKCSQLDTTEKQ